jgi:hypothetical protein
VTKIAGGITCTNLMQTWDVEEYLTSSKSHFNVKNECEGRFIIVGPAAIDCTCRTSTCVVVTFIKAAFVLS